MTKKFDALLETKHQLIVELVKLKETLREVCSELGYSAHGRYTAALAIYLTKHKIDYSHFRTSRSFPKNIVECTCPQCGIIFSKNINNTKEAGKITCSHDCGNKYFSQKQQYGRHKGLGFDTSYNYVDLLSKYLESKSLEKSCVVCKSTEVLDCHHVDEDRNNNETQNLVFLCPNHHMALHRNSSNQVFEAIVSHLDYRDSLE